MAAMLRIVPAAYCSGILVKQKAALTEASAASNAAMKPLVPKRSRE